LGWKFRIYVSRLDRVFGRGASRVNAHIMRLAVLYEDVRLENYAMVAESIPAIDQLGAEYRRMYFMRRSIATLREFAEAVPKLEDELAFAEIRSRFGPKEKRQWDKSVAFFRRRYQYLQKIRNDFGGHFGFSPAWHAVQNLTSTAIAIEYERNSVRRTIAMRHKYVGEIVAVGMGHHKRGETSRDHFRLMFRLALTGWAMPPAAWRS
jgi:hypothetical protein